MTFTIPHFSPLQLGTIYCVGKNYAKHIDEMGGQRPGAPVLFLKPRSSVIYSPAIVRLPDISSDVHHEVEMVLLIGATVHRATAREARAAIRAIAIGIDFTARDLQSDAKKAGLPWALSKGFDTFAPIGNFKEVTGDDDLSACTLELTVNDNVRQSGTTADMLWPPEELVATISQHMTLLPGDLIFTGTPEGVSRVEKGDRIRASLNQTDSVLDVQISS
ncbi:MAG: fumarylacetoacetate hydrolase family protein [Balneolaceae bacterium]